MREEQIRRIIQQELRKTDRRTVYQTDIPKGTIKHRHLEADMIVRGLASNRPNGSTDVKCYFATDTGVLSIWDGSTWLDVTLS